MGQMITQFSTIRALSLIAAFVAGVAVTALLLPASEPDYQTQSLKTRIKSLEAQISGRDTAITKIARRERELSQLMKSADQKNAALESDVAAITQKTARAEKRLADSKKRGKENEPILPDSLDDNDLISRLDRLLAGMSVGKGKAG